MNTIPKHIIWLSGMPRSGTTWLSQIFASAPEVRLKFCPLFSYEFKNKLDENASSDDWKELFKDVYNTKSEYLDQDYLRNQGFVPRFQSHLEEPPYLVIKSTRFHNLMPHLLANHQKIKFLHVVRDPRASIHSWLTNSFEFPEYADARVEWRSGACRKSGVGEFWGFEDWKFVNSQALRLQEEYPERFKIFQYEDIVASPMKYIEEIFRFYEIGLHNQTMSFIEQSRSNHSSSKRSVFKDPKKTINWRGQLDSKIAKQCESETKASELHIFLRD